MNRSFLAISLRTGAYYRVLGGVENLEDFVIPTEIQLANKI